jgi:hypothetical protein
MLKITIPFVSVLDFGGNIMTEDEIKVEFKELRTAYNAAEDDLVAFALEHELDLYIDGKGLLLLEARSYEGLERGDWYTSTMSCS